MCFCKNIILNVMVVCPCVGFASEFIFMCVLLNMCTCVIVCVCVSCHVQGSCVVTVWLLFGDLVVPLWTCWINYRGKMTNILEQEAVITTICVFSCPPWWPRPERHNFTVYMCHHLNSCKSGWHNVQNTWKHQMYILKLGEHKLSDPSLLSCQPFLIIDQIVDQGQGAIGYY